MCEITAAAATPPSQTRVVEIIAAVLGKEIPPTNGTYLTTPPIRPLHGEPHYKRAHCTEGVHCTVNDDGGTILALDAVVME